MDGSKCHSIWPHHLTTPLDASAICTDYVNTTCMSTTNGSEAKYSNAQGQGKTPENNTKILFLSIQCEANNYSLESKTRKSDCGQSCKLVTKCTRHSSLVHLPVVWEDPGSNLTAGGCVYCDGHYDIVFGMGCAPLLQCLGQLNLPPSIGRQNDDQLTG